ncbi:unnamed protein product, partial [Ectocarpus sp. 4 AP-2014]
MCQRMQRRVLESTLFEYWNRLLAMCAFETCANPMDHTRSTHVFMSSPLHLWVSKRIADASCDSSAMLSSRRQVENTTSTFAPDLVSEELYQRFIENEQRVRGQDYRPFSASYFRKTWKKARPLVKVTTFGDFMKCTECTELKEKLR